MKEILVKIRGRPVLHLRFLDEVEVEVVVRSSGEGEKVEVEQDIEAPASVPGEAEEVGAVGVLAGEAAPPPDVPLAGAGVAGGESASQDVDQSIRTLISVTLEEAEAEHAKPSTSVETGREAEAKRESSQQTVQDVGNIIRRIIGLGVEE